MLMTDRSRAIAILVGLMAGAAPALAQKPPSATLTGITRDMACAPASPLVRPATPLVVEQGRETHKNMFGTGDALVIRGGTAQGVQRGDEYYLRRVVQDMFTEPVRGVYPISIHTTGVVQIVETQADVSVGVVTYSCDGVIIGDYLERFEMPAPPASQAGDTPDFARPGRVILADDRRQTGAAGAFMVLDRGSDHGLRAGQRLTIFRTTLKGAGPVATIGTATVYTVQAETSSIRIESSIDAVYVGDLVAVHR
jgi:hypothetical protein